MKTEINKITQGAMMVAIIGVFLFVDQQLTGILISQMGWILSIPMILYSSQVEMKYSLCVFLSAVLLACMIVPFQSIFYLFSALVLGIVYGNGVRMKWKNSKLLFWTMVCTFVSCLLSMYVFAAFFGYDLIAERNEIIEMLENAHLFNGEVFFMDVNTLYNVLDISAFMLIVIAESLCVHLLSHLIFIKLKINTERIQLRFDFHYPKILSIGGILSIIGVMMMKFAEMGATFQFILTFFCLNLFIVNFVYGMIVIRSMKKLPKGIWMVCLVLPLLWPFVMFIGIIDGLCDGKIKRRGIYG